ncbi:hypothetical protein BWQ96_05595 [Gracilariopsis chorda]|uniref:Uncharacterized protein n=1 Tax=Gracilariopsis chorda TaxID=448386 RepID=A0A2V3IRC8_9FLOR|nr:hypothetical protein BWQ96_05595 [Gracilariopsis chorda]|eukprot:PXF44653.1 hypothetical protein BWQ96_05595 [Gracilariopsis chorda]
MCPAPLSFVNRAPFCRPAQSSAPSICTRRPLQANINETTDPVRGDEIAAKIARLRKQNRLKSQRPQETNSSAADASQTSEQKTETSFPHHFSDLPDWKKEDILNNQISEAEKFFNKGSTVESFSETKGSTQAELDETDYQPKVSTWGVFPRPENISRTYGGGRRIKSGGVDLESEESKARDEAVKKRLEAYRATRGIDMKKEDEHREKIESALNESANLMKKSLPYKAINMLESVTEFTSDRSRLGGKVLLALALAYEAVGRREDAKKTYMCLRTNPFTEISSKAKQLLQGFQAMEQLGIEDETQKKGYRVMRFSLPDVNAGVEKRYETVVRHEDQVDSETEKISLGTNLALIALMGGPVLLLLFLELWRR